MITITSCLPLQQFTLADKLKWLRATIKTHPTDLFLLPQEFFGGHYCQILAEQNGLEPPPLHVEQEWLINKIGSIAKDLKTAIGVGACVSDKNGIATEDYLYFERDGSLVGSHRKFALPAYDDVRAKGAGDLWPEMSYSRRSTLVNIPRLDLKIGTLFCWEIFNLTLAPAYALAGCNLIVHPIKFAPRGWLKLKEVGGRRKIVGFGNEPRSGEWIDKLIMTSRHLTLCPIAVSCNSWCLGEKMLGLVGHVDEITGSTELLDVPSFPSAEVVHSFQVNPKFYAGFDHLYSIGAFKEATGSVEGFHSLGAWTMHAKVRRLEAHLLGGTTRMDCLLKTAAAGRQKSSTKARMSALIGRPPRKLKRVKAA